MAEQKRGALGNLTAVDVENVAVRRLAIRGQHPCNVAGRIAFGAFDHVQLDPLKLCRQLSSFLQHGIYPPVFSSISGLNPKLPTCRTSLERLWSM